MQTANPLVSTTAPIVVGEMLAGKYRVDHTLGEGGMGIVVAATNVALGHKVAIKLLRQTALSNTEALGRFEREARAAASLRSEHVARAIDIGKLPDGRPYMVMEFLDGKDLGDVIEHDPPLAVPDAIDFVLQACEAIAEAHAAGIIHRDLKPKNLFLAKTVDGRPLVKVLDFGISKFEGPNQDMSLTRTTEIIGSPSYMSPEQLRASKNVDTRTDIWALGVILYELLTKRLPFYANTVTELVAVVLMENPVPMRVQRPDVSDALEYVVSRCLAKKVDERFQSVAELAHALHPFASGTNVGFAERVQGVANQSASGRLSANAMPQVPSSGGSLPAGGSSSARLQVHGGTSVAWGETQVTAPPPRKRGPSHAAIAALVCGAVVMAGAAGASAIWYVKRAHATATPVISAPASAIPLPPGRKDLPPMDSAASTATAPVDVPTALPDSRQIAPAGATTSTALAAKPHGAPPPPTTKPPSAPSSGHAAAPDDPLSNIGRR